MNQDANSLMNAPETWRPACTQDRRAKDIPIASYHRYDELISAVDSAIGGPIRILVLYISDPAQLPAAQDTPDIWVEKPIASIRDEVQDCFCGLAPQAYAEGRRMKRPPGATPWKRLNDSDPAQGNSRA